MTDAVVNAIPQGTEWVRDAGWIGVGVFALAFLVATLVCIPASPLTALAGFVFGPVAGTLLISPVGVLSATLAFVIGRSLARPWVRQRLRTRPRLAAIDAAVGRQGLRITLLLRLASVVPFAPLSYILSASHMRQRDFVLASWLGLLPGTFFYAYLGSLVRSVSLLLDGPPAAASRMGQVFYVSGLIAALAALVVIVHTARRALSHVIKPPNTNDAQFS